MPKRQLTFPMIIVIILAGAAIGWFAADRMPGQTPPDIALMWETKSLDKNSSSSSGTPSFASTDRAIEAAARVFSRSELIGMTKHEVIDYLGDPGVKSDSIYNFPFYPPTSGDVLVYRFDNGAWGTQYNIVFDSTGHVVLIDPLPIE